MSDAERAKLLDALARSRRDLEQEMAKKNGGGGEGKKNLGGEGGRGSSVGVHDDANVAWGAALRRHAERAQPAASSSAAAASKPPPPAAAGCGAGGGAVGKAAAAAAAGDAGEAMDTAMSVAVRTAEEAKERGNERFRLQVSQKSPATSKEKTTEESCY